jgi:hypothetical protein
MKVLPVVTLVILTILVGTPTACEYSEQPRAYYPDYNDNLHKGLWVPKIFPKDITDIHEQHEIDTAKVWLRFKLGNQSINLSNYQKIDKADINYTRPFLTTWWFSDLPDHYNYYRGSCTGSIQSSTLAISTNSKVVYWWCK